MELLPDVPMNNGELLRRMAALKETFERNFEIPWFLALLEGLPVDPLLIKDIRDFFKIDQSWAVTEARSREGIHDLELFILKNARMHGRAMEGNLRSSLQNGGKLIPRE